MPRVIRGISSTNYILKFLGASQNPGVTQVLKANDRVGNWGTVLSRRCTSTFGSCKAIAFVGKLGQRPRP